MLGDTAHDSISCYVDDDGDFHTPLTGPPSNDKRNGIAFSDRGDNNGLSSQMKYVNVAIGPQHFELVCKIGEGAFGQVLLVKPRLQSTVMSYSTPYAMKVISKKLLRKKNNLAYMRSERDIMTKVRVC